MLPRITVKNAGPGSLGVLIDLWHRTWYAQVPPEAHHAYRMRLFTSPWARKNLQVLVLEENGAPLSGMMALTLSVRLDGRVLKVAGVAAVVTAPEQRGRGLAARLLAIAHRRFQDSGHHAALLFSDIGTAYYAKLGYVPWPTTRYTLRAPAVALPRGHSVRPAVPGDLPAMRALQERFQEPYALALEKSVPYWRHQLLRARARDKMFGIKRPSSGRFVIEATGAPVAYARVTARDGALTVTEAAHLPDREHALAALIAARAQAESAATVDLLAPAALVKALGLPVTRREPCDKMMLAPLTLPPGSVDSVNHCFWREDWF